MRGGWLGALLLGATLVAGTACETTRSRAEVLATKDSGEARVYDVDAGTARRLAAKTLEAAGFRDLEEDAGGASMTARRKLSGESSATLAAAWIEDAGPKSSRVTFATLREVSVAVRSPASTEELHARFAGFVQLEGR